MTHAAGDNVQGANFIQSVVCTSPTTPAKGGPVLFGVMTGVAMTDEATTGPLTGKTTVNFGPEVWCLSVAGIDGSGNSAVAVGDLIYYTNADSPKLNKKTTGALFGIALEVVLTGATTAIKIWKIVSPGAASLGTGTVNTTNLAAGAVTAPKLSATLITGFIPLDITALRIIASNVIGNLTEGMLLDGNSAPSLQRVNAATDKALRVIWAASSSIECQFPPVPKPPDLDGASVLTVHLLIAKDTNTDNAVTVDIQVFDGIGDTECGAATAALATASLTEYSASVAAADLGDHPGFLNVSLVPGAHTTDAIHLHAAWIEYTRA